MTLPLYILLLARRWPSSGFWSCIHAPFTNPGEIAAYEFAKIQRGERERELARNKIDDDDSEDSDDEGDKDQKDEEAVLTNKSLAKLMIPQVLLALPLVCFFLRLN